ncbi:phosphoribosylglycinamide formyltransferase [Ancylomarina sp. 16SWW S1-10-2]|uniref:phosphoribosylglycinamide formyltransferase n=1 Tax=Ancylomarina sp. 16SWW S1-10-2 TaxID=2499681 RepID=UPI0012AE4680|nr:phosphoribosylglycinamide formyltransferase [Ancylomarina sp. 16SWW S1-10-2]MRT94167.1 phosphoribosylglycinamide formyltransferase [Ancylomarina sp. 16SWW S1-10-2]
MKKIAILASGSGSNAENIVNYFESNSDVEISIILSNKKDAFVLERAKKLNIPSQSFTRKDFYETDTIVDLLVEMQIDLVVLAGFLWLAPHSLIQAFPNRIVNIHPALLPNYGGKGMYGMNVHNAVINNKEKESGITIHLVNEKYDDGKTILQTKCQINKNDTAEDLANEIHKLEYEYFPRAIASYLNQL